MNLSIPIKKAFYPAEYPGILETGNEGEALLWKSAGSGRYALYLRPFEPRREIQAQIAAARESIRRRMKARWIFKEVGAYILFACDELPNLPASALGVDRTGLHAVIIQGIHLAAPRGEHLVRLSTWGGRPFGGSDRIAEKIRGLAL